MKTCLESRGLWPWLESYVVWMRILEKHPVVSSGKLRTVMNGSTK